MIISITYGNEKYDRSKKFNCRMALRMGADKAIAFGPEDISDDYKKKNYEIWSQPRGGGYWLWKPYIINKMLEKINEDDYLIYTDAGAVFVKPIKYLIKDMEDTGTDLMVFSLTLLEKYYTKRDAFILMECDEPIYTDTPQILSGYIIIKKTTRTISLIQEWLKYIQDARIVTDMPNCSGEKNYSGFIENRHDQSCLSLLCKKYEIKPFRDPSQYGVNAGLWPKDVQERSTYPQMIDSYRDYRVGNMFQLKLRDKAWYKYVTLNWYKKLISKMLKA